MNIYTNNLPYINNVPLNKLLNRDEIINNTNLTENFILNKTILVTGGAGSIGYEICRQLLLKGAKKVIAFDINENDLYQMSLDFITFVKRKKFIIEIGSVRDYLKIEWILNYYNPDIIYHCAAHKHVPTMELCPCEGVKNNIIGTFNVANLALLKNISNFVLISTDKACEPTGIMGKTKALAELIVTALSQNSNVTKMAIVRFGNVLGSKGSILPMFIEQIQNHAPIYITHPDMHRFFMTIQEAVMLVTEASAMACGGEIFTLDMGEQISIESLACNLIKLYGLVPYVDIPIKYIGIRQGEKLWEKLLSNNTSTISTLNPHIFKTSAQMTDGNAFLSRIHILENYCKLNDSIGTVKELDKILLAFSTEKTSNLQAI